MNEKLNLLKKIWKSFTKGYNTFLFNLPNIILHTVVILVGVFMIAMFILAIIAKFNDNSVKKENNLKEVEIVYYNNENGDKCVYTNFNKKSVIDDKGFAVIEVPSKLIIKLDEAPNELSIELEGLHFDEYNKNKFYIKNFIVEKKWIIDDKKAK